MTNYDEELDKLKSKIKCYPNFPKEGVLFRDIFSVLREASGLRTVLDLMLMKIKALKWDHVNLVVGVESRGFILGPLLALELSAGFVPVRKKGRLPGSCKEISYTLEYRSDVLEIQADSIKAEDKVLIVDDLIATGGSLNATCNLVRTLNAEIVGCLVLLELEELNGSKLVDAPVASLIQF